MRVTTSRWESKLEEAIESMSRAIAIEPQNESWLGHNLPLLMQRRLAVKPTLDEGLLANASSLQPVAIRTLPTWLLEVRQSANGRGRGVFARRLIPKGSTAHAPPPSLARGRPVAELAVAPTLWRVACACAHRRIAHSLPGLVLGFYIGEYILTGEDLARHYPDGIEASGADYLFNLQGHDPPTIIDAGDPNKSNWCRYVNSKASHKKEERYSVDTSSRLIDGQSAAVATALCAMRAGHWACCVSARRESTITAPCCTRTPPCPSHAGAWCVELTSNRVVLPGEELLVDYGVEYWEGMDKVPV